MLPQTTTARCGTSKQADCERLFSPPAGRKDDSFAQVLAAKLPEPEQKKVPSMLPPAKNARCGASNQADCASRVVKYDWMSVDWAYRGGAADMPNPHPGKGKSDE